MQRQKELGFKIFTDGELRRLNFMSDFNDAVEGIDQSDNLLRTWQAGAAGSSTQVSRVPGIVVGKIKQTRRLTQHELAYMKQHSPGDIKITLPTANQFPAIYYKKGISDKVYPTYSAFLWDIVPIIKAEIQALVNEGVHYVQIDAPRYSYYIDPKWRNYIKNEMGFDPDAALDEAIRVDNACLEGAKRDGVILAIHLCRGNNRSQWYAEGGYDAIAEKLFGAAPGRRVSARVRVGAGRHLRAVALRAARQDGGTRAREQQASRAGVARPTQEAHRRGEQVRAAGKLGTQSAVRLCLDDGREPAH